MRIHIAAYHTRGAIYKNDLSHCAGNTRFAMV